MKISRNENENHHEVVVSDSQSAGAMTASHVPAASNRAGLPHLVKQLPQCIQQRIVVLGAEHLGNKAAARRQELNRQRQGINNQCTLHAKQAPRDRQ